MIYGIFSLLAIFFSCYTCCPKESQWRMRAEAYCNHSIQYRCLHSYYEDNEYIEDCNGPSLFFPGHKLTSFKKYADGFQCAIERYQPLNFSSNGNSDCIYSKSYCNEEGQILYDIGSSRDDLLCRCDYRNAYAFLFKTEHSCYCVPSYEDCTCYKLLCPKDMVLSPDKKCVQNNISFSSKCPFHKQSKLDEEKFDPSQPAIMSKIQGYSTINTGKTFLPPVVAMALLNVFMWIYILFWNIRPLLKKVSKGGNTRNLVGTRTEVQGSQLLENAAVPEPLYYLIEGEGKHEKKYQEITDNLLKSNLVHPLYKVWCKSNRIKLKWTYNVENQDGKRLILLVKKSTEKSWNYNFSGGTHFSDGEVIIYGLESNTAYQFCIFMFDKYQYDVEPLKYVSSLINTSIRPIDIIHLEKIENEPLYVYRLPTVENIAARNLEAKTRKLSLGKPNEDEDEITIMVLGATGSGKTTVVDVMVNYILGVNFTDNYRFTIIDLVSSELCKIEDQTISQTEWITCYTIHKESCANLDYTINIIDTPGFGDTSGIDHDKKLIEQIYALFTEKGERGLVGINAVCFVTQAPFMRLTATQKYILDSVLSLFGRDIKDNFCSIITFSDGDYPPVIKVLSKVKEIPLLCSKYFTFNSGCVFKKRDTDIEAMYWAMGCKSCDLLLTYVSNLKTKSLRLSSEVLECRKRFQEYIRDLKNQADIYLTEIRELQLEWETNATINTQTQKSIKALKNNIVKQVKTRQEKVDFLLTTIKSITDKLELKALRPNISINEYIDLLIASEEIERKQGFEIRVAGLIEYKQQLNYSDVVQQFKNFVSHTCQCIDNS